MLFLFLVNFTKNWLYDQILVKITNIMNNFLGVNKTKNWTKFEINFNCYHDQMLVILAKIGHATNFNCHRNQNLVIFTKNWSCNQFKVSSQPKFGVFLPKICHVTNLNCHQD